MTTNKNEKLLLSSFSLVVIMMFIGSLIINFEKIDFLYVLLSLFSIIKFIK